MKKTTASFEQASIAAHLLKWTVFVIPVAATVGSLVALFLWLLDKATHLRYQNGWLLFLLPPAGVFIYALYRWLGKNAGEGNNLIMDEIHEPGGGVPLRMAPMVLVTTVITHLFGGCTLILDLDELTLRYAISKPVADDRREKDFRGWAEGDASAALALRAKEPIARRLASQRSDAVERCQRAWKIVEHG